MVHVVDGGIESQGKRRFLVFGLLFAEGDQIGDAGVLVLLEIEAQDLSSTSPDLKGWALMDSTPAWAGRS